MMQYKCLNGHRSTVTALFYQLQTGLGIKRGTLGSTPNIPF